MPRASRVPRDDAVAVVEKFIDYFKKKPYPPYKSEVWTDMSISLGGRWNAHAVLINVTNNRRSIVSIACAKNGIAFNDSTPNTTMDLTLNDSGNVDFNDSWELEEDSSNLDSFKVTISPDQWKSMHESSPVQYGDKKYLVLRRNVWTDVLSLLIYKQTQLPCAFVFKNSKMYAAMDSVYFVRIKGHCKSKACNNPIYCYIDKDPGNAAFDMRIQTRDTIYDKHEDIKRPLRGLRRQQVGQAVFFEGCGNWQKQEVLKYTEYGEHVPPHIPNLDVLRQSKMSYVNDKLKIQPSDGKDIINTIEKLQNTTPYNGFIYEVKRDKFYVSFGTPGQIHAYKQYHKTVRPHSTISVDGTGSIIKPLTRYDGSQSGHIFLYSIVINFEGTTLSVYDMLTESQETDIFWWWLNHWQRLGAPRPAFAVCDSSRALLNGMSMSFNHQTVKTFIETCFLYASKSPEYYYRPAINTYIRLDTAHFIVMIRRWKCMKTQRHSVVRQFFLYCIAIMCDCQTLQEFHNIFSLTCAVALHEFHDTKIRITNSTVYEARKKLETHIGNRNFSYCKEEDVIDEQEVNYGDEMQDKDATNKSRIKEWIDKIVSTCRVVDILGTEPNPFYFKDFIERFMPLAYEFTLWTSVAIPYEVRHGTSTFSEGHFNDVKHRVLKNYPRPIRVDKFLKLEFDDNNGGAAIVASKIRNFKQFKRPSPKQSYDYGNHEQTQTARIVDASNPNSDLRTDVDSNNAPDVIIKHSFIQKNLSGKNTVMQPYAYNNNNEEVQCVEIVDNPAIYSAHQDIGLDIDIDNNNGPNVKGKEYTTQSLIQKNMSTGKSVGKYFRSKPDIEYCNNKNNNVRKSWLLKNGSQVQYSASINGMPYFAYNTCPWDSIVQILANSAMDDAEYLQTIQKSVNKTLQFVHKFVETGPTAALYRQRVKVLATLFEDKIKANHDHHYLLTSYSVDMWDSVAAVWERCFRSEPSAIDSYQCSKCSRNSLPIPSLYVNHKIIHERGFQNLQDALQIQVLSRTIACSNANCDKECTTERTYNTQVFVELDIRPNMQSTHGLNCHLNDLPRILELNDDQYQLAGVIALIPGHFMAYCRRGNGQWELCNDMNSKVVRTSPKTMIEPHGAIFTKIRKTYNKPPLQSLDEEYFAARSPLNDSDVTSQDNWRNKGTIEPLHYESDDNNNMSIETLDVTNSYPPTLSMGDEEYQVLQIVHKTKN